MAWVKLPDEWADSPVAEQIGDAAAMLHLRALSWSNRNFADGFIPESRPRRLTAHDDVEDLVNRLVGAGLWDRISGGFQITAAKGLLEHQLTRAEVEDFKAKKAEAGSKGGKASAQARAQAKAEASAQSNAQAKFNPSSTSSSPRPQTTSPSTGATASNPSTPEETSPVTPGDAGGLFGDINPDLAADSDNPNQGFTPPELVRGGVGNDGVKQSTPTSKSTLRDEDGDDRDQDEDGQDDESLAGFRADSYAEDHDDGDDDGAEWDYGDALPWDRGASTHVRDLARRSRIGAVK
jgi:hypothetical protein